MLANQAAQGCVEACGRVASFVLADSQQPAADPISTKMKTRRNIVGPDPTYHVAMVVKKVDMHLHLFPLVLCGNPGG